jgi:hypothetical protein
MKVDSDQGGNGGFSGFQIQQQFPPVNEGISSWNFCHM